MNARPSSIIPELPKAADMLERVHAEATELRNFTITFLSLLLYVAIIISSTTHEQILRIDPVKLPLLNVDIPIVGFYWFMPGFLFFLHLYILLQHYLFSQLAFRFRDALERETDTDTKNHLRRSLGNLPFLHWLAGRHGGFMNFLMKAITVVSLIVWPVWTFWWLQAAFLPYHDNTIVWWQRVFLLLDATLLAYLWAKILDDQDDAGRWWKPWLAPLCYDLAKPFKAMLGWLCRQSVLPQRLHRVLIRLNISLGIQGNNGANPDYPATLKMVSTRWLLAVFLFIALFFSFVVSTVPYSWEDKLWKTMLLFLDSRIDPDIEKFPAVANNTRRIFPLTNWLHEQRKVYLQDNERNDYDPKRLRECGDEKTAEKQSQSDKEPKCYSVDGFFPRNLILNERVLAANQDLPAELLSQLDAKNDKTAPDALAKIQGLDLRRRHLEYADFSQSSLPNADLRSARLDVANFSSAKLEKARLENAEMSGANLNDAKLPGADLKGAQFRTANLSKALLTGADLSDAQFPEADMSDAQLQRTKLRNAQLPNANLSKAVLTSSDLGYVNLQRANLSRAQLYNANLSGAILVEADLSNAELSGSDLSSANLSGADLRCAGFQGANLSYAMLLGADINGFIGFIPSDFSGADLSGANLSDANLRSADLSGADTQI